MARKSHKYAQGKNKRMKERGTPNTRNIIYIIIKLKSLKKRTQEWKGRQIAVL